MVDPADYARVLAEMDAHGGATTLALRKIARRAALSRAPRPMTRRSRRGLPAQLGETTPKTRAIAGKLAEALRYGENPHQSAAFYRTGEQRFGVATAMQLQGKELSYNNLNDTDAAYELVAEFDPKASAAVAIIKHANPCGVALGAIAGRGLRARRSPAIRSARSAASSRSTARSTREAAREIVKIFTEVIIAPDASDEAKAIVAEKKNLRLLLAGGLPDPKARGLDVPLARRRLPRAVARQRRVAELSSRS